jgi:hypothetical protein
MNGIYQEIETTLLNNIVLVANKQGKDKDYIGAAVASYLQWREALIKKAVVDGLDSGSVYDFDFLGRENVDTTAPPSCS